MDTLGIPERLFYRYLSQAFEHDRQLLAEQDIKTSWRWNFRSCTTGWQVHISAVDTIIARNENNIAAKDKIDAEAASCEVAVAIVKLAFEGPIVLKNFAAYLR
jgi:hypothetical protein